jgi:hypothetical protein
MKDPDPSGVAFMQDFFEEWTSFHLIGRRFKLIKVHLPESSAQRYEKHRANDREEDHKQETHPHVAASRRSAPPCPVPSPRKKLVAALERFDGYKSDANRKKTKRYEVNKHKRADV